MPEAQSISQKSTDYFWHVPVSFVIEIHFPERILMAQLIVYQSFLCPARRIRVSELKESPCPGGKGYKL